MAQTILDSKGIGHRTARYEHQLSQDDGRNCAAFIQIECKTIRNSLDDKTKTAPDPPRSKKTLLVCEFTSVTTCSQGSARTTGSRYSRSPRVSPAAILLAAPDGTLCLLPLFSGIAQSHSCPKEAVTRPNATRERLQSTRRARAQSIVREAALATAGCVVASYGFAVPASAVITGTNAASMHAIPKAIIIIFDMTRTLKPNKETIGPKC